MRRVRLVLLAVAVVCLGSARASAQDADPAPLVFAGFAQSYGLGVSVYIPKAPLADTLVDLQAPSTTAELDSIGTTVGFAALPSPGELVLSVPGLVTGLVAQGAAGLPPIPIPSLPDYPLFIRADSSFPEQTLGDGPYQLRANATQTDAQGTARVGLALDAAGKVALANSTSRVTVAEGQAVASASSSVQGVSIGPLTIGEISTSARVAVDSGGEPEASSEVHIVAARLAGIPIEIGKDGISIAGTNIPLPVGQTLAGILNAAGLKVEFLEATQDGSSAQAGGLRIVQAIPGGLGAGDGTLTFTFGFAAARMSPPPGQVDFDADPGPPVDLGSTGGDLPSFDSGDAGIDLPSTGLTPSAPVAPSVGDQRPAQLDLELTGLSRPVDLRTVYLVGGVLALLALALSFLIQILGVRT